MTSQPPKDLRTILAANIRAARRARGLTQRELAGRVNGVDPQAISRWERAESVPQTGNMSALAEELEQDFGWFYTDHGEAVAA